MKRLCYVFAFIFLVMCATGCNRSSYMTVMQNPQFEALPEGKASVTFFRISPIGWAIQAPIAIQDGDDIHLVGIASIQTKIRQVVDAGEHIWVVGGEDASLIKGELEAGKNYYVRIEPCVGLWKARFEGATMNPINLASEKVQKQLKKCIYVDAQEFGDVWFRDHKSSMRAKLQDALQEWRDNPRNCCYIRPDDGVDAIY